VTDVEKRIERAAANGSMRFKISCLPWELLADRLVLITLTVPGSTWLDNVPNAEALAQCREAFLRRWERKFGEPPMGIWWVEFQTSGAPHIHLYVGLPSSVSAEDLDGFRVRAAMRRGLVAEHGKYRGRGLTPRIGSHNGQAHADNLGGAFGEWLLESWADIVASADANHRFRGVDVEPSYWGSEDFVRENVARVVGYLAAEGGKCRRRNRRRSSGRSVIGGGSFAAVACSGPLGSLRNWRRKNCSWQLPRDLNGGWPCIGELCAATSVAG
jgi:hypothetical protein